MNIPLKGATGWTCSLMALALCAVLCGCSRARTRAQQILGAPLPASAKEIRIAHAAQIITHDYFVSAVVSPEDYAVLVKQLGLTHYSGLLQWWSGALQAPGIPWWTPAQTNDAGTWFHSNNLLLRSSDTLSYSTNIVSRYDDGRMFFRVHIVRLEPRRQPH